MVRQSRIAKTVAGSRWPPAATGLWPASFDSWVPVLFLASGAAGLIYQVVWTQDLVLIFGDTTLAIVTTVTAFLAGLGIGSLVGAAVGARLRRALAVYGLLEITVGCLALLMPLAFDVIATVFRTAYLSLPPTEVALIRFGLAFVALAPVTLLMGMSLPVLTRHLVREDPDVGGADSPALRPEHAGRGGRVGGQRLPADRAARAARHDAGGGRAESVLPASAPCSSRGRSGRRRPRPRPEAEPRPPLHGRQRLLLAVTFTSGLVSLALEVLWTRMMLQGTGSSIYVFVAVVAVFLIGIAGGSLIYERQQRDRSPQMATLGALLAAAAALALVPMIVSNMYGPPLAAAGGRLILPVTSDPRVHLPAHGPAVRRQRRPGQPGCRTRVRGQHRRVRGRHGAGRLRADPDAGARARRSSRCASSWRWSAARWRSGPRRAGEMLRPAGRASPPRQRCWLVLFIPAARLTYVQREIARDRRPTAHFEDSVASVDVTGGKPLGPQPVHQRRGHHQAHDRHQGAGLRAEGRPAERHDDAQHLLRHGLDVPVLDHSGLHTTAVDLDPTVPSVMSLVLPGRRASTCTARSATSSSATVATMSACPTSATT